MNVAVDVDYREGGHAAAAALVFSDWKAAVADAQLVRRIDGVAPYRSGRFFERELPCILELLGRLNRVADTVVIDGYVTLGADRREGLGAHLHRALAGRTRVIGVAKSGFEGTPPECRLLRGHSTRPLYVTCMGLDLGEAKRLIAGMHGESRMPTLLASVDRICREADV